MTHCNHMICFQKQQDTHIFQCVKTQLLPHNQESIKDVWKPTGSLYSHMYMQTHPYESSSWVEEGKGSDILWY